MPAPALPPYVYAFTSALAAGLALIAATTWAAVLVSAPVGARRQVDDDVVAGDGDESGESFAPGFLNSAVIRLPPRWPMAFENSCTASGWLVAFGLEPSAVVPAIIAIAGRW